MFAKGSCLPLKSARRSATVTISAPLASSASRIFSGEANFPVPRIRRERNSCPAMVNGRFTEDISRQRRRLSVVCREFYERAKWHGRPARASLDNYHTGGTPVPLPIAPDRRSALPWQQQDVPATKSARRSPGDGR